MKIYSKTGDTGETGLFGGKRVSKDDDRVEAYGSVDELNSFLGSLADALDKTSDLYIFLTKEVQCRLFDLGSHLATDPSGTFQLPLGLEEGDLLALENWIDRMTEELPPLKNFILPGGHPVVSAAHICRTVCRRAERAVIRLHHLSPVEGIVLQYLNRLSDFFFVLARHLSKQTGTEEIIWQKRT